MNHAGEIGPLSRMVRPEVGLITTVAPAHLEFFASVEAIADAKAELFEGLEPGGTAILPRDNPHFDRLAAAARVAGVSEIQGFGEGAGSTARLVSCRCGAESSAVEIEIAGVRLAYTLSLPGRHLVMNSLGVLLAARAAGADLQAAARTLGTLPPVKGRGVRRLAGAAVGDQHQPLGGLVHPQPGAARFGIAPGDDLRRIGPARQRQCGAGVEFVAVGGNHQGPARVRGKCQRGDTHQAGPIRSGLSPSG